METTINQSKENSLSKKEISIVKSGGNLQKDEKYIDFNQIDMLPDSSCDLIRVYNCDHFTANTRVQFLLTLFKKIRYGGQLMLCGVDPYLLSYSFYVGDLKIDIFNHIIENSASLISVELLKQILSENNFNVVGLSYNNIQYILEAKRNAPKS